jgi:hypothetical protein
MDVAVVASLAVDDHRAGEHEPVDPTACHGLQQYGGAQAVAAHVVVDVVDIHPEADLGRQVDDHVDTGQRGVHRCRVTYVGDREAGGVLRRFSVYILTK